MTFLQAFFRTYCIAPMRGPKMDRITNGAQREPFMPRLPPRIGNVDEKNFLGVVPLKDIDFEFIGYLLACHLVIEHYLDEFLISRAPDLTWDGPRLTFSQKAALFPHLIFPNGVEVIAGIRHMNALRNKLAHRLETKPEEFDYLPFVRLLEKANVEETPTKPLEILEQFTEAVGFCFIGWLASDAYRTTWRQAKQKGSAKKS